MVLRRQKVDKKTIKNTAPAQSCYWWWGTCTMVGKELWRAWEHEPIGLTEVWGWCSSPGAEPGRRGGVRQGKALWSWKLWRASRWHCALYKFSLLSILQASKRDGKFVNFSVISRQDNGRIVGLLFSCFILVSASPGPSELATDPIISKHVLSRCTRGRYVYSKTCAKFFIHTTFLMLKISGGSHAHGHDAAGYGAGPPIIMSNCHTDARHTIAPNN